MTDFMQRLDGAMPTVQKWIEGLHRRHQSSAVAAHDTGFSRLSEHYPVELLRATRAVAVDTIPFPPVSLLGLPEFEEMASMDMAGITFLDMYFFRPDASSEGLHFHELVHVVQWNALGLRPFLLTYALGIVQYGYVASPLEAKAYELQNQFESGKLRSFVVKEIEAHAVVARSAAEGIFRQYGIEMGA